MKKTLLFALLAFVTTPSIAVYGQEKEGCPTIFVDGQTYTTNPCSIRLTMVNGKEDGSFMFSIKPKNMTRYGFTIPNYGYGFPTWSLLAEPASGSAHGTQFVTVTIKNAKLPLEYNSKKKIYQGYLPIYIFKLGNSKNDTDFLELPITIIVKPDVKAPSNTGKK